MKTMIRNLSSGYQKFGINRLAFISFLLISIISFAQSTTNSNIDKIQFYTKENRELHFSNDSIYVIVLKNNKSCMNCFAVINNYIKTIHDKSNIKLIAISHSDSTSLDRKRNIYELQNIFSAISNFGVSYNTIVTDKTLTPELAIIKNKTFRHFSYEEIFGDGFDIVSPKVQKEISEILNHK